MQVSSFSFVAGQRQRSARGQTQALVLSCCSMLVLLFASAAYGHGVYITAWHENDSVCTESYYSRKNRVIGGTVIMRGADDTVLGEATTDRRGIACFSQRPQGQDLVFQVDASPGHRATCTLSDSSVTAPLAAQLALSVASSATQSAPSVAPLVTLAEPSATQVPGIQVKEIIVLSAGTEPHEYSEAGTPSISPLSWQKELQPVVQEVVQPAMRAIQAQLHEMQNQLRDMQDQLRSMQNQGVGFRDIVGGIGWILGLFALAGYLKRRRRARQG